MKKHKDAGLKQSSGIFFAVNHSQNRFFQVLNLNFLKKKQKKDVLSSFYFDILPKYGILLTVVK